ncbi:hypothetical protein B0A80_20350, partial [Flavobacterium tructae]|uniref:WbqC family protein n=1 Tax=Flavobacterium tructae TaxID=1114873 RepID=UPI000B7152BB
EYISIAELAYESVISISKYLDLKTIFSFSSLDYVDTKLLDRESRLIEIVKRNKSSSYINPLGGKELYNKESFAQHGIELSFIHSNKVTYKQFGNEFVPWLSIIDVLMFNSTEEINIMLDQFELL